MLYELTLFIPSGSFHAILKSPAVRDGYVHAKQVGECTELDLAGNPLYTECTPRDIYVNGAFVLKEFKGNLESF